jgi:hypothetical protein
MDTDTDGGLWSSIHASLAAQYALDDGETTSSAIFIGPTVYCRGYLAASCLLMNAFVACGAMQIARGAS